VKLVKTTALVMKMLVVFTCHQSWLVVLKTFSVLQELTKQDMTAYHAETVPTTTISVATQWLATTNKLLAELTKTELMDLPSVKIAYKEEMNVALTNHEHAETWASNVDSDNTTNQQIPCAKDVKMMDLSAVLQLPLLVKTPVFSVTQEPICSMLQENQLFALIAKTMVLNAVPQPPVTTKELLVNQDVNQKEMLYVKIVSPILLNVANLYHQFKILAETNLSNASLDFIDLLQLNANLN
jgi:hypothetical protein